MYQTGHTYPLPPSCDLCGIELVTASKFLRSLDGSDEIDEGGKMGRMGSTPGGGKLDHCRRFLLRFYIGAVHHCVTADEGCDPPCVFITVITPAIFLQQVILVGHLE